MLPRSSTLIATCLIAAATACGSQAGGSSHGTRTTSETEAASTVQSSARETTVDNDYELANVTSSQDVRQYVRSLAPMGANMRKLRSLVRSLPHGGDPFTAAAGWDTAASLDTDSLTVARRIRAPKLLAQAHRRLMRGLRTMARAERLLAHDLRNLSPEAERDMQTRLPRMAKRAAVDVVTWYREAAYWMETLHVRKPAWMPLILTSH